MDKQIIQIATYPFGNCDPKSVEVLECTDYEIRFNPLGRRLKSNEVKSVVKDATGIIAGTEPYTREVIKQCRNLRVLSRVGVGLDNVDFKACKENGVIVTYTPDAPTDGVADLTVAQIINLLRGICLSNDSVRKGFWQRIVGKSVNEVKIGVLGVGRIGKKVIQRLSSFDANIYACDLKPDYKFGEKHNLKWVNKRELFENCELITVHIPMNNSNYNCIGPKELSSMPDGAFLINTSRGPILDENALLSHLQNQHLGGAALDVFVNEPYQGPLSEFENVIFTAHIGASANSCRIKMEYEAAQDCVRVLQGNKPLNVVTEDLFE
ncbi:MAG: Phosphonate dehydrogenase [Planctomycetes bacterium ADurb.Bin401]|nr:MAG: Phosphonate dehydrogenase [Planctomycetes bacterium ADurb.Bin401]